MDFHVTEKKVPTLNNIFKKFKDDFLYSGCKDSLRKEMHQLGFRWKKFKNNRSLLIERPEIRFLRINFLRKISQYRKDNRPLIYMDETYIHSSHTREKGWSDGSNKGLNKPISKGSRLIILNAGGENGFVANAYVRWKSSCSTGDYHNEMNFDNYKKWVQEKLVPNLPANSVLVIDNAPYHNKQIDKCPTSSTRKEDMQKWLRGKNISFRADMLKPELYNLIKASKPQYKTYAIDQCLKEKGHDVLRLPPYHPDLNPIEMVWGSMKKYVAQKNVDFNFEKVRDYCDDFFRDFSTETWKKYCERAKTFEKEFLSKEPMVDIIVEELIINIDHDTDTSDSDTSEFSEGETEEEIIDYNIPSHSPQPQPACSKSAF